MNKSIKKEKAKLKRNSKRRDRIKKTKKNKFILKERLIKEKKIKFNKEQEELNKILSSREGGGGFSNYNVTFEKNIELAFLRKKQK